MIVSLCLLSLITVSPAVQDRPNTARWTYSAELDEEQSAWVEKTLAGLSVREMAGQLMMDWTPGGYAAIESDQYDRSIRGIEGGVGGLWMMGGVPHTRAAKINELQARAKVPLLVMTSGDLGKRQMALPWDSWQLFGGGTDVPSAMAFSAAGDVPSLREAARIIGLEARATGANMISDSGGINLLKDLANVLGNRTFGTTRSRRHG